MKDTLFKIVRVALWGQPYEEGLYAEDFSRILDVAEQQTVFGLVFDALKDIQIEGMGDKMPVYEAVGFLEQIKQQNSLSNKELADFQGYAIRMDLIILLSKGRL